MCTVHRQIHLSERSCGVNINLDDTLTFYFVAEIDLDDGN